MDWARWARWARWTRARVGWVALAMTLAPGCGDDGTSDDGSVDASTSGTAASGTTASGTTASAGTAESTSAVASTGATTGPATSDDTTASASASSGTGCEEGVGPDDGTEVGSCEECSPEQLCMQLTESGGPADGGGPMETFFCFPPPTCCDAGLDCECAGHLCPDYDRGSGVEVSCSTDESVLYCSVGFP